MQKFYGKIEKVYIPTENNQDVMFSNKIGLQHMGIPGNLRGG